MADENGTKSGRMTDAALLQLIAAYEKASLGSSVAAGATISTTVYPSQQTLTTLEIDRYNAINMYFARPLGNEVENRSQVVLPELRDTIEWIMPQLMRMFMGSKEMVRFEPENQQDEQQAEMETMVVNHVLLNLNSGFFVLHDFFKDALLLRNGYAEIGYVEKTETTIERYTGLSAMELTLVLANMSEDETEIIEQREYTKNVPIGMDMPGATPILGIPEMQMPCFDLKIRRRRKSGSVKVECLPPEEMRVSPQARQGLDDIPFVAHIAQTSRSELIQEGFDRATIDAIPQGKVNWLEMDELARNTVVDQLSVENPADTSMQTVEDRTVIIMVDYDGDGIAELRRVKVAGQKILENEEIEECCFASCSPIRMPHRHTGLSLYDLISDLQVIKTTLWRQGLDNLYLANNSRTAVDWQNCNIDDLLTSRPGGIIRTKGSPSNSIMQMQTPSNLVEQVLPAMQYIDGMRESRTGVGKGTTGMDADELQDVAVGTKVAAMDAAVLKIELIARLLAEGVKTICLKVHNALRRHQDGELTYKIYGKWITVDPSNWGKRSTLTVNVGLGSGNQQEKRANIAMLGQGQAQLAPFGLVGPKQAYETFKTLCESLGFMQPDQYAMDPDSDAYKQMMANKPQQPPAPQVQAAQIKAQSDQAVAQSKQQGQILDLKGKLVTEQGKLQAAQAQAQAETTHAVLSTHSDRQMQQQQFAEDEKLALIRAFAQILSVQLKGANDNAGVLLAQDVREATADGA